MSSILHFVTSNPGKVTQLQTIARDLNTSLDIQMLEAEYPEDKTKETVEHVAREGAQWCAEHFQKSVLVTDVGLFIPALHGFPGVNTAFTLKRIGTYGLIKLLQGTKDRSVEWRLALGYAAPGGEAHVFTASLMGTIATEERGVDGFGFDSLFVPTDETQTLAEDTVMRDRRAPLREAMTQFIAWYAAT